MKVTSAGRSAPGKSATLSSRTSVEPIRSPLLPVSRPVRKISDFAYRTPQQYRREAYERTAADRGGDLFPEPYWFLPSLGEAIARAEHRDPCYARSEWVESGGPFDPMPAIPVPARDFGRDERTVGVDGE